MKIFIFLAVVFGTLCGSTNITHATNKISANGNWCINKRIGVEIANEPKSFRCTQNAVGNKRTTESTQYVTNPASIRWGVVTIVAVTAPSPQSCSIIPININVLGEQADYGARGLSIYALDFKKRKIGQIDVIPKGSRMTVGQSNFGFKVCGSSWISKDPNGRINAYNSALYCGLRFYFAPEILPTNQSSMQYFFANC